MLAFAVVIGSAGQIHLGQAAPSATRISIKLAAHTMDSQRTICVGDKVGIQVTAEMRTETSLGVTFQNLPGVEIEAHVDAGSNGTISPARSWTDLAGETQGAANLTFFAERTGSMSVTFKGKVNKKTLEGVKVGGGTVTAKLSLTVEDCTYKVMTISRWQIPGLANVNIMAYIQDAGIAKDPGGVYRGTAVVTWAASAERVGDCTITIHTPFNSYADLTGRAEDPDSLLVDVIYEIAMIQSDTVCIGPNGVEAVGHNLFALTPDPLKLKVPVSTGADRQLLQALKDLQSPISGPVVIPGSAIVSVTRAARR